MNIVVLFSNKGDEDCQRLPVIWDGLANTTVFELTRDMSSNELEEMTSEALATPCDILLVCGHGSSYGLFSPNFDEYVLHDYNCSVLNQRQTVGLFCYASSFAHRNKLNGFYTSMFISNINEAVDHCVCCTKEEIETQNIQFFLKVRQLIELGTPLSDWKFYVDIDSNNVAQFNAGNTQYFNWSNN